MADFTVDKAVILAAGNGSHLLPFSNYVPKPFLPFAGKPIIYHQIEDLYSCGIKDIIIISRKDCDNDGAFRIQNERIRKLSEELGPKGIKIRLVYQEENPLTGKPMGTADAITTAKDLLTGHNYIVMLGDLIIESRNEASYLKDMIRHFSGNPMFSADAVDRESAKKGGILRSRRLEDLLEMHEAVEKPDDAMLDSIESADGKYNVMWGGVYILNANSMDYLESVEPGKDGEKNITDAISLQCKKENSKAYGLLIDNKRYNCRDFGRIEHWLENNLEDGNIKKFSESLNEYPEEFGRIVRKFALEKYGKNLNDPSL